jgi:CIC family chloride channel protein
MAFGELAHHPLGPTAGDPALYAAVAMGAVFTAAVRAPRTSLASVVEMTGDFTLTLPVMLAVAISTTLSRGLSYGTIYTTKLLRRGIDIDRPTARHAFDELTVADAMHPLPTSIDTTCVSANGADGGTSGGGAELARLLGPVTRIRQPQALIANDSLAQALRQLVLYGRDGLPVLDTDGQHLRGWVTNQHVLGAVARQLAAAEPDIAAGHRAAEWADPHAGQSGHDPGSGLPGYRIIEHTLAADSPAVGRALGELAWPAGHLPVSVLHHRRLLEPNPGLRLTAADRISLLAPLPARHHDADQQAPLDTAGAALRTSRDDR